MILERIISLIFPHRCVGCGEIIDEGEYLCEYCLEMIDSCVGDKFCIKCGSLKKDCVCKNRVFSFEGAAASFYNEGIARKAMYKFKFRRAVYLSKFFTQSMLLSLRQFFFGINFDYITFVPMYFSSKKKRGYNQSELLAKDISKTIAVPLYENLLYCKRKKRRQHLTPLKERFDNVKGIYYTKSVLHGETILLIDDIKTTGATLEECTKVLLKAGAGRVYCLTGLTTKRRKKKGKKNGN